MSTPTLQELALLKTALGDDEDYHSTFDDILEEKLMQLDPEWMTAMRQVYKDSRMRRWCA